MMKMKYLLLGISVLLFWSCSSSDDDSPSTYTFEASGLPAWQTDLTSNDADPSWQDIDRTKYESWMYVTVKLEDELAKHASTDDRMVVFIGDEQRTRPANPNLYDDGSVYFVLTIGGNSTDREINFRLCYWSAQLHQLFSIEERSTFTPELPYGNTSDYEPPLLKGSGKYPVQQQLTVNMPSQAPFTPADGDRVAAFVGDECRGVGSIGEPFTVFRTSASEAIQLRYYSVQQGGIYTLLQSITLGENEDNTVTPSF